MSFTEEQKEIMKGIKKNRKLITNYHSDINKSLMLFALILAAFLFIGNASAWTYNCTPLPLAGYISFGSPYSSTVWTTGPNGGGLSTAQAKAMCDSCGYPNTTVGVYFQSYSKYNDGAGTSRREYNLGNYTDGDANTRYVGRSLVCNNAYMIKTSNGQCMGAGTGYSEYLIGMPQTLSECAAGTYYVEPLSATFTVVPQAGNQSLTVNITPNVKGNNLTRVVWDYDSNLGVETKSTGMNTTFNKTYTTAGRFTIRLVAYNDTSSVSASQRVDVYNYTLGITPTPTITPSLTPTPAPNGTNVSSPINVYYLDYYNLSPVYSLNIGMQDMDDVGSGWFNVTTGSNSNEYSFSGYGSGGNKPLVYNHRYWFQVQKAGYVQKDNQVTYTSGFARFGNYLMPTSYNPTSSTFTLQVKLMDNVKGEITDSTVGTVTISNQSSTWTSTITNPPAGLAIFAGLTPSSSYKIGINLVGYETYTGYFSSSSSMANTQQYYNAYLTSKATLPSSYTLSVTPSSGTLNDTYTMKLTGDISGATAISYKYQTTQSSLLNFVATSGYTQYAKVTGAWKGWDGSTFSVATSDPSLVTGKIQGTSNPSVDSMTVTAYITVNGNVYQCTDTVIMVSQGKTPKAIVAYDMSTYQGASSPNKWDFTARIYDVYDNLWTNTTYTIDNAGSMYYYITPNKLYMYYGSAVGFYDTAPITKVFTGTQGEGGFEFRFYKQTSAPTAENITLYANVRNVSSYSISSARVLFSDGQSCYTNMQGSCGVYALVGSNYTATASAYGYSSGTGSITTSNTSSNVINIVLARSSTSGSNIGAGNVIPTTGIKTTPTFTNTSGLNGTPLQQYTCVTDTKDLPPFGILMNMVACAGITAPNMQGVVACALLMFIFAMGLSNRGKSGIGVMGGIVIGGVIGLAAGLIPFWILIFVIIVCGLVFAKLFVSSQSQG